MRKNIPMKERENESDALEIKMRSRRGLKALV